MSRFSAIFAILLVLLVAVSADSQWWDDGSWEDSPDWLQPDWNHDEKTYGPSNSTEKVCIHGEFRCTDVSTDRCDHGVWISNPCPSGTKCLGCADFECVFITQYDTLKAQLCVNEHKDCETENVHPYKSKNDTHPPETCNHGDFRCTKSSTDRCDHGKWVAFPCPTGTKCLGCGDFECVFESDFDRLEKQLCTGRTNWTIAEQQSYDMEEKVMSSGSKVAMSMLGMVGVIIAAIL